ncbi:MAG: CPBP family intramembrane glutamic endopeptidase [Pseudomonadota bacterium]|nr:CPBP family intramembrane glutamic endopeptidase [Pseudomonadota bacterium]
MRNLVHRYPTLTFFFLTYCLTWSVALPLLFSKRGWIDLYIPHALEGLAAFGPFAAALICTYFLFGRKGIRDFFLSCINWRVGKIWTSFVVLSPFFVLITALILTPTNDLSHTASKIFEFSLNIAFLELIIFGSLFQGVGEEPGWRGFSLPRLRERFGSIVSTLLLFPVWLFWHIPMFLSRPEFNFSAWLGFSVGIFSATIILTLIYDATESIFMAILWHVLINFTRGIALAVSTSAFLMFGQVITVAASFIMLFWLARNAGYLPKYLFQKDKSTR